MSIFKRLATLVKSNVNDAISKAEDPEKMLTQVISDMNEQYSRAKGSVASAIADEKRLERAYQNEVEKVNEWAKKAELAVVNGNDELALAALSRKNEYQATADKYKVEWEGQKAATDKLKASLKDLGDKIEEAKRKKGLLVARAKRAEAQKSIQSTMAGLNDSSAFEAFERMSQKVDSIEFEADSYDELNDLQQKDTLEDQFKALEKGTSSDLDELAALKAKLNK